MKKKRSLFSSFSHRISHPRADTQSRRIRRKFCHRPFWCQFWPLWHQSHQLWQNSTKRSSLRLCHFYRIFGRPSWSADSTHASWQGLCLPWYQTHSRGLKNYFHFDHVKMSMSIYWRQAYSNTCTVNVYSQLFFLSLTRLLFVLYTCMHEMISMLRKGG